MVNGYLREPNISSVERLAGSGTAQSGQEGTLYGVEQ